MLSLFQGLSTKLEWFQVLSFRRGSKKKSATRFKNMQYVFLHSGDIQQIITTSLFESSN